MRSFISRSSGWILVAAVVTLWKVNSDLTDKRYLPAPDIVVRRLVELCNGRDLQTTVIPSLERLALGLSLAVIVGTTLGLLLGYYSEVAEPWVRPVLEFLRAVPPPALLPIAFLVLGPSTLMRVLIIALGCIWPILWTTMDGAATINPQVLDSARMCGVGRSTLLTRVVLPAVSPSLFTGIRIAVSLGLIMMVISEIVASPDGLGAFIFSSQRRFRVVDTYAAVLMLSLIGISLNLILVATQRRVLGWHRGSLGGRVG